MNDIDLLANPYLRDKPYIIARAAVIEAGYPELAPYLHAATLAIKRGVPNSEKRFVSDWFEHVRPTLDRVWIIGKTHRIVHVYFCTDPSGQTCWAQMHWHEPPHLEDVFDMYLRLIDRKERICICGRSA